jgi:hypothetical protein
MSRASGARDGVRAERVPAYGGERARSLGNRDAGYSGTPLPRKLGIKPGMTVALFGAPDDFVSTLGDLPEGAVLRSGGKGPCGLILWFVRKEGELSRGIARMARAAGEGPIWIAWPKRTARAPGSPGPSEARVRASGLSAGLVDYKVCAIDATWSGLLFRRRRAGG